MDKGLFLRTGALKEGHFLLASGLHSGHYFQAQTLFKHPETASKIGREIAKMWAGKKVEKVVSLAIGGIVPGQEVARHLKVEHVFFERRKGVLSLERGFTVGKGERVLLVEDVITTGGSLKEAIKLLKRKKARIVGITATVLRGRTDLKYPLKVLLKADWPKYEPDRCPLCRNGVVLYAPGTKKSS